ncbi:kinase-like domain-containing protein [Mycena rebaudengoi]|nr:kinase-like domain-containing protein [Mycena rebaudengoi]
MRPRTSLLSFLTSPTTLFAFLTRLASHLYHFSLRSAFYAPSMSPSRYSPSFALPDLTGKFVDNGALQLLQLLGSGAYGKIYKAVDTASRPGARVYYAVKCMHRYDPDSREGLNQANEIAVHKMFSTPDLVFVVLDLASGDVFSALAERQCYRENPAVIKQAFGEILDAVEFCHRNSVFHRDLKPENILCNFSGTGIRLADFGLATQLGVSTQFGCGSRYYMSPESLSRNYGRPCYSTRHSDLWALSVIFTNMISGRHPWGTAEISDECFAAFRDDPNYLLRKLSITPAAKRTPPALLPRQSPATPDALALEWVVAAPPSAAEDLETPRPALPARFPRPPKCPAFALDSDSSSGSSSPSSSVSLHALAARFPRPPNPAFPSASDSSSASRSAFVPAVAHFPRPPRCPAFSIDSDSSSDSSASSASAPSASSSASLPAVAHFPRPPRHPAFSIDSDSSSASSSASLPCSSSSSSDPSTASSSASFLPTPSVHPALVSHPRVISAPDLVLGAAPLVKAPGLRTHALTGSTKPKPCAPPLVPAQAPWYPYTPKVGLYAPIPKSGAYRTVADHGRPTLPTRRRPNAVRVAEGH